MKKYYVEYEYPALFVADREVKEIKSRRIKNVEITPRLSAFRFFEREETIVNGETLQGKPKNHGGFYYIDGTIIHQKEATGILRENMICNDWKRAIKTRFGNVYPMDDKDKVLRIEALS